SYKTMDSNTPEIQFSVERLKRYLQTHPHEATQNALNYLEDFLVLSSEFKQLEAELIATQNHLIELQTKINTRASISLPSFLNT
ncbi:MAG: hypothetical protein ACRC1Z_08325, partial [Waterburya sp.]